MNSQSSNKEFQSPGYYLSICDWLHSKEFQQKIPTLITLNNDDLQLYQNHLKKESQKPKYVAILANKKPVSSSDEESDKSLKEASESESNSDGSKSVISSDNEDDSFQVAEVSTMVFRLPGNIKFLFRHVYTDELKALMKTYECKFEFSPNSITIKRENPTYLESLRSELYEMTRQIYVKELSLRHYNALSSELLASKLNQMKVFIYRNKGTDLIWARKKLVSEKQFLEVIDKQILSKCRKTVHIFGPERTKAQKEVKCELFEVISANMAEGIKKIELMYEVEVEVISKYFEFVVHLESEEFFQQVKPKIHNLFQKSLLFSFAADLSPRKKLQLTNLYYRKYRHIELKIFERRIAVCIPLPNIQHSFESLLQDLVKMDAFIPSSNLFISFSHLKDKQLLQKLVNHHLPQGITFEDQVGICSYKANIKGNEANVFSSTLKTLAECLVGETLRDETVEYNQTFDESSGDSSELSDSYLKDMSDSK